MGRRRRVGPPLLDPPAFVVDASVVAKWGFPEPSSGAASRLLAARAAGHIALIAPDLLVPELGALCRRKARAGDVTPEAVAELFALMLAVAPELVRSDEVARPALALALRHGRPFAEMVHLALALRETCPYVTADERLVGVLASSFPCVRYVADVALP